MAVLSATASPETVLNQVAQAVQQLPDKNTQNNRAAATAILGALVLAPKVIRSILRSDMMRESPFYQEILQEGRQTGIETGKLPAQETIALNLLAAGMNVEQVAKLTDLPLEKVQILATRDNGN